MQKKESVDQNKAVYSDDSCYRYSLTKIWNENKPKAVFIGINPSEATEIILDKTVMHVKNHLVHSGYGEVEIVNLFSYRSKDQKKLVNREEEHEQHTITFIRTALTNAELIIVGWGRSAEKEARYRNAITMVKDELRDYPGKVKCFKDKKGNVNCHPSIGYSEAWELVDYE